MNNFLQKTKDKNQKVLTKTQIDGAKMHISK